MSNVRIDINWGAIRGRLSDAITDGQVMFDEQVVKDSNNFVPFDTGNLASSGIRNSLYGTGQVKWDTPYARKLYYNPQYNFSKDSNPQAGGLWFERAKSASLPLWLTMLNQTFRQNF